MSVTFRPEEGTLLGWRAEHPCGARSTEVFPATREGCAAASQAKVVCSDEYCDEYSVFVTPVYEDEAPEVNVSNVNARAILDALGHSLDADDELCGGEDAESFMGRVLMAVAVAPQDAGVPTHHVTPNFIDCGRPEGYLQDRLEALREVAEYAASKGREVVWS